MEKIPCRNDLEWTDYVLGQFDELEMEGKHPRVEGLRRIADKLLGGIIEEGCDLICEPNQSNGMRACVKAWAVFNKLRFESLADASPENCQEDFVTYLVAMADTRAKGRVYRNALMLRHVVSAEEINKSINVRTNTLSDESIHSGQIAAINLLIERLKNISLPKILDELNIKYKLNNSGKVNLQLLSHTDAIEIFKKLNSISDEQFAEQKGK